MIKDLGGNKILNFSETIKSSNCLFSQTPYKYESLLIAAGVKHTFPEPSLLLYYKSGGKAQLVIEGTEFEFSEGDAAFVQNHKFTFNGHTDSHLYVVGNERAATSESFHKIVKKQDLKVVIKPWGKEIWISIPEQSFSLKEIHINAGTKTSLQYHQYKTETNLIFNGQIKLYYKVNPTKPNDEVIASDLGVKILASGNVIHVQPHNIHRVEAITDVILIEASTNHLDDVIRIQDDFSRDNGRIEKEHG